MLSVFFRPTARTHTATANPLITEDGSTQQEFHQSETSEYVITQTMKGSTIHDPPYHWHLVQTETFHINKSTVKAIVEGEETIVPEGSDFTIPSRTYHTFHNACDTEPLSLSVKLDPDSRIRDEKFFRNTFSYQDDCRKQGKQPSIIQMMLFLHFFDCPVALPGPRVVMIPVSRALMWVIGVLVGKWILGYKEQYSEYCEVEAV